MTESCFQGTFLPKDANGFIVNDAAKWKIPPPFLPIIARVKKMIVGTLSDSLHSIYLTGSVPRGVAKIYESDLDLFVILSPKASGNLQGVIEESYGEIGQKTDVVSKIDIELWRFEEVFPLGTSINSIKIKSTLSVFDIILKNTSLCIYGDDLSKYIPPIKLGVALANDELIVISLDIQQAREALMEGVSEEGVAYWCRRVMKNIIRAGFSLCIPIIHEQTREVQLCAQVFSYHYPRLTKFTEKALYWIKNPSCNAEEILSFLNNQTPLLLKEVDLWMEKYNPERLQEMPRD